MILHDYLPSGNGYKVRWTLAHLGLDYSWRDVDIHAGQTHTPDYLALNPAGQVPTLVLNDGRTLSESNAIIRYLADDSPLVPTDPYLHSKMLQWQFWEQYRHEPAIAVARFIHHYAMDTRADELPTLMDKGRNALRVMDAHLGRQSWFVGDTPTLADVSLYAYTHVAEEGGFDLASYPAVEAWLARFRELPGHIAITDRPQSRT